MADNTLCSIREQLDNLNDATDNINTLEIRLDNAKRDFRETQCIFNKEMSGLSRKHSKHIAKSRIFFDLKAKENELKNSAQTAAENYKKKQIIYDLSKQHLDELMRTSNIEEYSEVISQQIEMIHESENECEEAERIHEAKIGDLLKTESCLAKLGDEYRTSIKKSKQYYERKDYFMKKMKAQIELVTFLENQIQNKKESYSTSMRNLEIISEQIHFERSMNAENG